MLQNGTTLFTKHPPLKTFFIRLKLKILPNLPNLHSLFPTSPKYTNPSCLSCNNTKETIKHILITCPKYQLLRLELTLKISKLEQKLLPFTPLSPITLTYKKMKGNHPPNIIK